jgi:hypothetical protein
MEIGDIYIDRKPFRINLPSYATKDVVDFAPRATVPGNSYVMSDLGLYQPLLQTDWQHGFGFHWYSDSSGYLSTVGNIDTRHDGLTMLYTKSTSSDTNNNIKRGSTTFNGALYTWGDAGLRKFESDTWSAPYTDAAVNYALNTGDYLLFAPNGARLKKIDTSGTITDAGLDADSSDYIWMIIHNGFIYAAKDGTNRIHYDSDPGAAALEGTTDDPGAIYCGVGNQPLLGAIVYSGNLYVSRTDGLWMIGEDNIARRVLDYSDAVSSDNFRSMISLNGYLFFPIRDRVIQWNGVRVAEVTPNRITDEFPYVVYGRFSHFISNDKFVLCIGRTNQNEYTESLLAWDGVGWHKLMDVATDGVGTCTMLSYDSVHNRLWYHIDDTADATYYIPLQNNTYPYLDFPTTGQHSLITSRMDMGFRRITKSMTSMFVEARNVTDTRYISIWYSIDGEEFVEWERVTSPGMIELHSPGGFATKEFNYIVFRFDFITDASTQSPILESYTINFIMRPETRVGYSFDIVAASGYEMEGHVDERTSTEIFEDVMNLRNSKSPVEFTGLLGETILGYLTSVRSQPVYRTLSMEGGGQNYIEYVISCSFVEMEHLVEDGTQE